MGPDNDNYYITIINAILMNGHDLLWVTRSQGVQYINIYDLIGRFLHFWSKCVPRRPSRFVVFASGRFERSLRSAVLRSDDSEPISQWSTPEAKLK